MARYKLILITLLLAILCIGLVNASLFKESNPTTIDSVFKELVANDPVKKEAVFKLDNPDIFAYGKDALKIEFKEIEGRVKSYKILIKANVTKIVQDPIYALEKICQSQATEKGGKNETICTDQEIIKEYKPKEIIVEDWVEIEGVPRGSIEYKIVADIDPISCGPLCTRYSVEWIPTFSGVLTEYTQDKWAWWNNTQNLSVGLMAYYDFNETPGSAVLIDKVAGKYNATPTGLANSTSGIIGNARGKYPLGSWFTASNFQSISETLSYSVNVWANVTSLGAANQAVWFIGCDTTNQVMMGGKNDVTNGQIVFWSQKAKVNEWDVVKANIFDNANNLNNWSMLTYTYTGSNKSMNLYFNGVFQATGVYGGTSTTPSCQTFYIGNLQDTTTNPAIHSYYDEFGFWNNTALNQTMITDLYNSGNGLQYLLTGEAAPLPNPNVTAVALSPYPAYTSSDLDCNATIVGANATYSAKYEIYVTPGTPTVIGQKDGILNNTNTKLGSLSHTLTSLGGVFDCRVNASQDMITYTVRNASVGTLITGIQILNYFPLDINLTNIFATEQNANYTLISNSNINSTIQTWHKTNNSVRDINYFVNGSAFSGYTSDHYRTNTTTIYSFYLDDNDIYGGIATYNLPFETTDDTAHNFFSLTGGNDFALIELINLVNNNNYSFFEAMYNVSGANVNIEIGYCNSSYTTGQIQSSNFCTLIFTDATPNTYNHCHSGAGVSCHHVIPFVINQTTGNINSVRVTNISYFYIRGRIGATLNIYNVGQEARPTALRVTTNGGTTITNRLANTSDSHLHQLRSDTTYYAYACYNDTYNLVCSSVRADQIDLTPLPPTSPEIYAPNNSIYGGRIYINWTAAASQTGTINRYNITLVNDSNRTRFIMTISNNTPSNLSASFCANTFLGSMIDARVDAYTSDGQTSFSTSPDFNITETIPINSTPASGYTVNNTILVNCSFNKQGIGMAFTGQICYNTSVVSETCGSNISVNFSNPIGLYNTSLTLSTEGWYTYHCQTIGGDCMNNTYGSNSSFVINKTVQINACQTLSTAGITYLLNQSVNKTTTCFTVSNENITLDCQGNNITGYNASASYGVTTTKLATTIKNCLIQNWSSPVYFNGDTADYGVVDRCTLYSTRLTSSVLAISSADNINITNSYMTGVYYGVYLAAGSHNVYINNVTAVSTTAVGIYGLYIANGDNSTILNSYFESTSSAMLLMGNNYIITNIIANATSSTGNAVSITANNSVLNNLALQGPYRGLSQIGNNNTFNNITIYLGALNYNVLTSGGSFNNYFSNITITTNTTQPVIYISGSNNNTFNNMTIISTGTGAAVQTAVGSSNNLVTNSYITLTGNTYPVNWAVGENNSFINNIANTKLSPVIGTSGNNIFGACSNNIENITDYSGNNFTYIRNAKDMIYNGGTYKGLGLCNVSNSVFNNLVSLNNSWNMYANNITVDNITTIGFSSAYMTNSVFKNSYTNTTSTTVSSMYLITSENNTFKNIISDGVANGNIQMYTNVTNNIFYNNTFYAGPTNGIWLQTAVYNNLFDMNRIYSTNATAANSLLLLQALANNNVFSNNVFDGVYRNSTMVSIRGTTTGNTSNNTFFNNIFMRSGQVLVLLLDNATNNIFYANNFSQASVYINDSSTLGGNALNTTEGNIYENVANGTVQVIGYNPSGYYANTFIGNSGTGYPYNAANSLGTIIGSITDYAPLTSLENRQPLVTIETPIQDQVFIKNYTNPWPISIMFNYTVSDYSALDKCWLATYNITPTYTTANPIDCTAAGGYITANVTLNLTGYGPYNITLYANDSFNNIGSVTRRVVLTQSITFVPYYPAGYYDSYVSILGVNYTRGLSYGFSYNCVGNTLTTNLKQRSGYDYLIVPPLVCNGSYNTVIGTYPIEGGYNIVDVGINVFDNDTLANIQYGEQRFGVSVNPPNISFNVDISGAGFVPVINGTFSNLTGIGINVNLTCTDDVIPILQYSIYYNNISFGYNNSNRSAGYVAEISTPLPYNGLNEFKGVCYNFFDNTTQYIFKRYYLTNITLVDEVTGGLLDITNITSVKLYNDNNMTVYNFKSTNSSEVWYISEGITSSTNTKLRFEFIYPSGTIVNRYLDVSLFASGEIRVCGNQDGTTFYTLKVQSASYRPALIESLFAKCYVAGDYTRFGYDQLYTIPMYTIARAYRVFKFVGNDAVALVDIDGSATTDVNLDTIEFYQTNYSIDIRGEGLAIRQTGTPGTMAIYYKNGQDNNLMATLQIYRTDTNAVIYTASNFTDPNEFATTINIVSMGLVNITNSTVFKAKITKISAQGMTTTVSKYFNMLGKTNILRSEFAIVIAILLTLFGLTFTAVKTTMGWFGMVTCFVSIVMLSMSMGAWYITFWLVLNVIIVIYILLGVLGKNMPSLVS